MFHKIIIRVNKSRNIRCVRREAHIGAMRNAYIFVRKLEELRPRGNPKRRWKDNIRLDLREIGWEGVEWVHLAHDRDQ
jgi:hypothetical protein